jgi:hypothetical protein
MSCKLIITHHTHKPTRGKNHPMSTPATRDLRAGSSNASKQTHPLCSASEKGGHGNQYVRGPSFIAAIIQTAFGITSTASGNSAVAANQPATAV